MQHRGEMQQRCDQTCYRERVAVVGTNQCIQEDEGESETGRERRTVVGANFLSKMMVL